MKHLLTFVFIGFLLPIKAQQSYPDSLKNALKSGNPREKKDALLRLSKWYSSNEQFSQAIDYADQCLTLAKTDGDNLTLAKSYSGLVVIYTLMEDFDKAQQNVVNGYQTARKQKDSLGMAYINYAEAYLQSTLSFKDKAIKNLHEALSKVSDMKKESRFVGYIYYSLYSIYADWNDIEKSYSYAQKCIDFATQAGDKNLLANAYIALGVVYATRFDKLKNRQDADSSVLLDANAIDLYRRYPSYVAYNTYCVALINQASYYLGYFDIKDKEIRKRVEDNITIALKMSNHLVNNQGIIASGYGMLSDICMQDNDLKGAEKFLMEAYLLLLQKKTPYYYTLSHIVQNLSDIQAKMGNFQKAYEFQQKVTEFNNLLFDQSSAETAKRLEAQYESKKKEQEMQALKEKSQSQKTQNYLLLALIAIGIIGSVFMLRSYHFNLKYSLAREKQLEAEHQEVELQIKLEREEQARLKAEQKLLEAQQQKLHDEVLAKELHIQHKNEVLQQLKEKITGDDVVNLKQVLRNESISDDDFDRTSFRIQEVHPNFFKNLNEKAKLKLTSLDLKYCAYLYLGMDTKQIAHQLNVEPKSVRMTKYRLKQKLDLDINTDLINYLKQITT